MEKMQDEVAQYALPRAAVADKGLVYVIRPSSVGMLVRFNVFLDDKEASSEMGYNRGNEYIYFYVSPGQHVISSKAENWADMTVTVKAGEVVYLKQEVEAFTRIQAPVKPYPTCIEVDAINLCNPGLSARPNLARRSAAIPTF